MNTTAVALTDILHALEYAPEEQRTALSDNERALLRVALQAFAEHGYEATSARQVALDAGLTAPMVNYYFGSKKGLYRAVGELVFRALVSEVLQTTNAAVGFRDGLHAYIGAHARFFERSPVSGEFVAMALYGPVAGQRILDPYLLHRPASRRLHQLFDDALASGEVVFRDDLDVEYMVNHAFGIVRNAMLFHVRQSRRSRSAEGDAASAIDLGRRDLVRDVELFLRAVSA
jgi:AcrR family transcriptional regulator